MSYTFRIRCRASNVYSLAIVNGEVILTKADQTDDRQLWYKDVRYGAGLKDEAGSPGFALVNKARGFSLKHSFGYCLQVRAVKFDPGYLDESVLWAESENLADGFRRIHMINNVDYIFDAEEAIPQYGGARDGTRLILFRWNGGKNQLWRIAPNTPDQAPAVRISCQSNHELSLAVRDGTALLARTEHDETQAWIQSFRNTGNVTDKEGHRSFAIVNKSTGKALRRSRGDQSVQVVNYSPDSVDVALLWTPSEDLGEGFHSIRSISHLNFVLDAAEGTPEFGGAHDGTPVILFQSHGGLNQKWKMVSFH